MGNFYRGAIVGLLSPMLLGLGAPKNHRIITEWSSIFEQILKVAYKKL
jgi:hypothetical protein